MADLKVRKWQAVQSTKYITVAPDQVTDGTFTFTCYGAFEVAEYLNTLVEAYEDLRAQAEGVQRFLDGQDYCVSTGIDDSLTFGYGQLDELGFWEFPIPEKLAKLRSAVRKVPRG